MSTMLDRKPRLLPKYGALTGLTEKNMTLSETNDRAALKLHYANEHPTSSENFEQTNSVIFTNLTKTIRTWIV